MMSGMSFGDELIGMRSKVYRNLTGASTVNGGRGSRYCARMATMTDAAVAVELKSSSKK